MIKLGLIGFPVSHSLSPKIQNAALKAAGLEGEYSLYPIQPEDKQGLEALLARARTGEIAGFNVTIPHKQNVIELMDELTPTAQAIGSVNIIYMRGKKLIGDNTDAQGFIIDLTKFIGRDRNGNQAIVLGAGGSARSVVYALLTDGWNVTLAARRIEQAKSLARAFPNYQLPITNLPSAPPFDVLMTSLSALNLVVNTTPVGMTPNKEESPLPENFPLSPNTHIYDLVYNPRETKLVRDARARGLKATTGLGMLIEQAALGFELWTGKNISSAVFRSALES